MKTRELLRPGDYLAGPAALWCRKDLTPTAKATYQALLYHLRDGDEWVYPSVERLVDLTACSRAATFTAIGELATAGLIERKPLRELVATGLIDLPSKKVDMRVNAYRFTRDPGESVPSQNPPNRPESGSVRNLDPSGIKTEPVQNQDPKYLRKYLRKNSPLSPRGGKGLPLHLKRPQTASRG